MEKFELSPVEVMEKLNWKKSKVYYWIKIGKFETVERNGDAKVVLSANDIERLRIPKNPGKFETFEESIKYSEEVQEYSKESVTKNYETFQKNLNSETFEFFNNALNTIKEIHQASLINYGQSVKLLTDGKNSLEDENLKLKAEYKAVSESLEKFKTESSEKFEAEKLEHQKSLKKYKFGIFTLCFVLISLILVIIGFFATFLSDDKKTEAELIPLPSQELTEVDWNTIPKSKRRN